MSKFRRNKGGIWILLATLLTLIFSCLDINAQTPPDPDRIGSISVRMTDRSTGEPVGGGTLLIYKVGQIGTDGGNFVWELTDEFGGCGADLTNIGTEGLAQDIANYVSVAPITHLEEVDINEEGYAEFPDYSAGLYLITQPVAAPGYEEIMPFLVTIPIEGPDAEWVYDVDASPKLELVKAPTATPTPTRKPTITPGGGRTTVTPRAGEPTITPGSGGGSNGGHDSNTTPTPDGYSLTTTPPAGRTTGTPGTGGSDGNPPSGRTTSSSIPSGSTGSNGGSSGSGYGTSTTASSTLPRTGQLWWPVPILAMIGLVFVVVGIRRSKGGSAKE